jgi:hypothetical protein
LVQVSVQEWAWALAQVSVQGLARVSLVRALAQVSAPLWLAQVSEQVLVPA